MTRILLLAFFAGLATLAVHIARGDPAALYLCSCGTHDDPDCTVHQIGRSTR